MPPESLPHDPTPPAGSGSPRGAWWLAGLAVCLLLFACFFEGLTGRGTIEAAGWLPYEDALYGPLAPTSQAAIERDFTPETLNQPWDSFIVSTFKAGELPLWQPFNGFGSPLLANAQSGPLNPFKLLLWNGVTGVSQAWFLVARLIFAGVGVLLLARSLGLGALAGSLAAGSFILSGFFLYHFHYSSVSSMVMLPWLMLAAERLVERPDGRSAALLGLGIGVAGLLGHAEPALFAAVGACLSAAMGLAVRAEERLRGFLALGLACLLGAAVAAIGVVPFVELVRESHSYLFVRESSFAASQFTTYSLSRIARLLALHGLSASAVMEVMNYNLFAGVVALGLAPLGLVRPGVRRPVTALLLTTGMAIVTFPPSNALVHLPFAPNSFYATALACLALGLAGANGLARLQTDARPRALALTGAWCLLLAALACFWHMREQAFFGHLPLGLGSPGELRGSLVAAALLGVLAVLAAWRPARRRGLAALVVAVAFIELATAARLAVPVHPNGTYAETPILSFLKAQPGPFRVTGDGGVFLPGTHVLHGIEGLDAVEAFHAQRYLFFLEALIQRRIEKMGTLFALAGPVAPDLLDLANVRYWLVTDRRTTAPLRAALARDPARYPVALRQATVTLYENTTVLPRARVVHQADFVPVDAAAAGRALALSPSRWRERALVETPSGRAPAGWQNRPLPPSPARLVARTGNTVTVETTLQAPGLLLLAESFYPGWQAEVDGLPAPLYAANVAFRGVPLEAGAHRVVFRYRPRSVLVGGAVSLGALFLIALLVLWRRSPRTERPAAA